MIISRTPLRVSFVGGGSDLPVFYQKEPGAVISSTINKYLYVTVNKKFDDGIRVAYSENEEVSTVEAVRHNIVRNTMQLLDIKGGIEITTIADIPSKGSGLGSSSSFTVGLLHALYAYQDHYVSHEQLAQDSCRVQMELCGEPIGKQDQYIAAFGGFNLIEFFPNESVLVSPIICNGATLTTIEQNMIVFYTGITRSASLLLKKEQEAILHDSKKHRIIHKMAQLAHELRSELQKNNVATFGEILHENWMLKKSISSGISTQAIEHWYDLARKAGAEGGKILGAGAGGFLMFFAPKEKHESIKAALSDLRCIPVGFESLGSSIIFYH